MSETSVNLDQVKFDICCAARLLYRQGLSVANAGHLSVAIDENTMLVNHFGPSFATLKPENIIRVDFSGKETWAGHEPTRAAAAPAARRSRFLFRAKHFTLSHSAQGPEQ